MPTTPELATKVRAYAREFSSCLRLGATLRDKFALAAATLRFHADKSGSTEFESGRDYRIHGRRRDYRVRLRPRTGDFFILHEVLTFRTYDLPEDLLKNRKIRTVVDLGANIGLASLFLHDLLSPEVLVAVEPLERNVDMLRCNLSSFSGSIRCEQAAVGRVSGVATILDAKAPTWGARFTSGGVGGGTVRLVTIPEIMEAHGLDRIGLLKIDIEGAEEEIFSGDCSWMGSVDVLLVELHSDLAETRFRVAGAMHGFRELASPSGGCVIAARPETAWA